jgi:hypothetical protein
MKQIFLLSLTILFSLISCKKEKFPDFDNLQGKWIEQTDNTAEYTLIFDSQTLYFIKPTTVDTLTYWLDKNKEFIYLTLKNDPSAGQTHTRIILNDKSKTLTIWGIFPSTTDQTTVTKFKK